MLIGFLPEFAQKWDAMEKRLADRRVKIKLAPFGGLRTQADTVKILKYRDDDYAVYVRSLKPGVIPVPKTVWRKIAPWGSSYHNYGAAGDAEVIEVDGVDVHQTPTRAPLWKSDPKRAAELYEKGMNEVRHAGIAVGLARIQDDDPHFQLPYSLAEDIRTYNAMSGKPNAGVAPITVISGLAILGLLALGFSKWFR